MSRKEKKAKAVALTSWRTNDGDRILLSRLAAGGRWLNSCRLAGYDPEMVNAWMDQDFVFARAVAGARMEGREHWLTRMGEVADRGVVTEKQKFAISEMTGDEVLVERVVERSESVKAIEIMAKIDNQEMFAKQVKVEVTRRDLTDEQKRVGLETAIKMGLLKVEEEERA